MPGRAPQEVVAYVGLGSNLGERRENILRAVGRLHKTPGIQVVAQSAIIETAPIGNTDQPYFLNSVISVKTTLKPKKLLKAMLGVERVMGRIRKERWGPRKIDLDLLLYGDQTVKEPGLTVPHPEIHNRPFVMAGLREVGAPIP